MTTDPVCKMEVDEETAATSCSYEGQTYYFCSQTCKEQFAQNPEKYTA